MNIVNGNLYPGKSWENVVLAKRLHGGKKLFGRQVQKGIQPLDLGPQASNFQIWQSKKRPLNQRIWDPKIRIR